MICAFLAVGIGVPAPTGAESPEVQPDRFTARSSGGMVAADHPLASEVGAEILQEGGNAADAAVATLLALGVLNPFASGLGGGGFCLARFAGGAVDVIDFRERAPGRAHRDMYIRDGEPNIRLAWRGGLAVGVPGEARGLEALHQKHGKVSWSAVVDPALRLATKGFDVGELLPMRLERTGGDFPADSDLAAAFRVDGRWVKEGDRLTRTQLGRALELLKTEGSNPFYEGKIAAAMVEATQRAGGLLEPEDLIDYRVTWREPVIGEYRGYQIYGMPPPSSGGIAIVEALNILERYDLATLGRNPESIHRIAESLKHAFADRATWLGDADFVDVPVSRLVSKEYADARPVRPDAVLESGAYGTAAQVPDDGGTTHVSIIDGDGNMAACTSTINTSFGALVYVPEFGILMNNEMGDFTAQPGVPNNYGLVGTEQNAVAPGKRPLSSMSPTLVVRDGEAFMSVGASGGPTIITGTLLAMIRTIDWGWEPGRAVSEPRIHHQWMPEKLYVEDLPEPWLDVLRRRGHVVDLRPSYNSVQMVVRNADGTLVGASDPRKKGRPAGVRTE